MAAATGPVSAREGFTKIKSIKRLGCPKEGVAPYIIILAISVVVLVVVGAGIFFKKNKIYAYVSSRDCERSEAKEGNK